jgi:hypothetical protein
MAERGSVPLVFGGGLDRETGVMAMQPGGMEDLRNVHLMRGKYQVRRGFERVMEFTDDLGNEQTDVIGGIAMQGRRAAVYVTYDEVNYIVNVFIGDHTGSWAAWLGEWPFKRDDDSDILSASNPYPPVVLLAEYNNLVFMAHTSNSVSERAQTYVVYYDETSGAYQLHGLTVGNPASDAPAGQWMDEHGTVTEQKVRFRGVVDHLEYMIGWGWGDQWEDRPELVRISQPGVPVAKVISGEAFDPLHYWIVGDEGDPVIRCLPAAESLLCFKETETWDLFGRSYLNFGYRKLDALYGMLEPRLAVNVEGAVFAWTNEGPRVFAPDGTSEGLEIPLELTLPEPYDLVAKGDDEYAFAVYMPVYRSVWWVFGRRVYCLYIREPGDWKWGYHELGFDPLCGFRLPQSGWGLVDPPTGYPSSPTMNDITDTTADVVVTNNSQDADETLEIWLKPGDGDWSLHKSTPVTSAATQEWTLESLKAGWDYDLAVRYRRGPYYTFGYESDDPATWPSTAQTSFTTTLAALPTINGALWSRTSSTVEQILVTITPPYTGADYDVELRRGAVLIDTESDVAGQFSHADEGLSPEANNSYDCRLRTPYVNGAYTSTTVVWGGPVSPTIQDAYPRPGHAESYVVEWGNATNLETEISDSLPTEIEANALDNLRYTQGVGQFTAIVGPISGSTGIQPWVAVRHKQTAFTVTDYSNHSAMQLTSALT